MTLAASQAGRPADLLRDGDHHPRVRAGVRAHRAGGKLFHPLAFTKTFAMIGSTLLAVTIVPVLCTWLVRGPFHSEERNVVMRVLLRIYDPVLDWALAPSQDGHCVRGAAAPGVGIVIAFGLPRPRRSRCSRLAPPLQRAHGGMGSEFMPPLNEGSLLFMPVLLPSTALTRSETHHGLAGSGDRGRRRKSLRVAGKLGRAETATDPAPVEMIETTIMLKPQNEWRAGHDARRSSIAELTAEAARMCPDTCRDFSSRSRTAS